MIASFVVPADRFIQFIQELRQRRLNPLPIREWRRPQGVLHKGLGGDLDAADERRNGAFFLMPGICQTVDDRIGGMESKRVVRLPRIGAKQGVEHPHIELDSLRRTVPSQCPSGPLCRVPEHGMGAPEPSESLWRIPPTRAPCELRPGVRVGGLLGWRRSGKSRTWEETSRNRDSTCQLPTRHRLGSPGRTRANRGRIGPDAGRGQAHGRQDFPTCGWRPDHLRLPPRKRFRCGDGAPCRASPSSAPRGRGLRRTDRSRTESEA